MKYAVQWVRSFFFALQMYLMMALMSLFFIPLTMVDRRWAYRAVRTYCRWVRWSAVWMIGLRSEIRGDPPQDEVLIASKHQSFFDIIMLVSVLARPKFIMKKELKYAPILGWFAGKLGCVMVDRGKRGAAITKMLDDVAKGGALPGQLVIYPQGTRVAPGDTLSYKVGTAALYSQLGQDCVPVACNVGVFWPRRAVYRAPGLAVLEFMPRIAAGQDNHSFLEDLERMIEERSNQLMADAGFTGF